MFSSLRHRWSWPILAILFKTFGLLVPNTITIIWLSNVSTFNIPHECLPRNAECSLSLIPTFLYLDAINLGNTIHYKSVISKISPYHKGHSVPIILYAYSIPIAPKYLTTWRSCMISILSNSSTNLQSSPFTCNPDGHNITGDHNIMNNTSLRDVFTKGSIYCEPKSINWKHNFKILMDSVDDYARQWAKREKENLDNLSGWV